MHRIKSLRFLFVFLAIVFLAGNSNAGDTLVVEHIDKSWNSKKVPKKGVCLRRGGDGFSPEIRISKIPESATLLKLMFTDMNFGKEGGHGGIQTTVNGKTEIIVPSFRDKLPAGFKGKKNIIVNRVGVLAEMIITMDHVRPSGSTHTKYLFMQ